MALSVDPGFHKPGRLGVQGAVRRLGQQLHEHLPMTLGEPPGVGPVKPSQRLFIESYHPPAIGRGNDAQGHCHGVRLCNR